MRHTSFFKRVLMLLLSLALLVAPCACGQSGKDSSSITTALPVAPSTSSTALGNVEAATNSMYTTITSTTTEQFEEGKQYTVSLLTKEAIERSDHDVYMDVSLEVSEDGNAVIVPLDLKQNTCVYPGLFVGDFTGDGIADIAIKIPTESADGLSPLLTYIYTYSEGKLMNRLSDDDINTYTYTVNYNANYIVEIYSKTLNQYFYGDNSGSFKEYPPLYEDGNARGLPIYDEMGQVSPNVPHYDRAIIHDMSVYNAIASPAGTGLEGTYNLCISQSIWGASLREYVGDMLTYLKWDATSGQFIADRQMYNSLH